MTDPLDEYVMQVRHVHATSCLPLLGPCCFDLGTCLRYMWAHMLDKQVMGCMPAGLAGTGARDMSHRYLTTVFIRNTLPAECSRI